MRTLITGAEGFIGGYLSASLRQDGHEVVHGLYRPGPGYAPGSGSREVPCDLNDRATVREVLARERPEVVYHLGALSDAHGSWQHPAETIQTNVLGTIHLFEGLREEGLSPRVFVAASSAEYGYTARNAHTLVEDDELRPVHPYGLSKVCQDLLSLQYHRAYGLPVIRGRIFNTIGPGKTGDAPSDFARQLVEVERGRLDHVDVGNLDTVRDFMDVRDMVRAIRQVTERGVPGEVYNLCTGTPVRLDELLNGILRRSRTPVTVRREPARCRAADEPWIVGDNRKLRALGGWAPQIPLEQTLQDIVEQCRGVEPPPAPLPG